MYHLKIVFQSIKYWRAKFPGRNKDDDDDDDDEEE